MKVDVKETSLVCPAKDTPRESLWLSEYDLFFPNVHNHSVHFFKPDVDAAIQSTADKTRILKQSLGEALVLFYPAAGRLGKDENGRAQIECNGKGAMFIVAEADCRVDEVLEIGDECLISKFKPLTHPVDYSHGLSSFPLLLSKVTYFSCGGMCVTVAFHRWIVDGSSAVYFMNSWASMARGCAVEKPIHDRRSITNLALPAPMFKHPEYDVDAMCGHRKPHPADLDRSTAYLKISPQDIVVLQEKANADADVNTKKYSSYESLAAHVWRCACKARRLPDEQKSALVFPVNARSRLLPPVPGELFGNVIQMSAPVVLAGEILNEPLSSTANRIRRAIMEKDDEYVRSGIAYLRDNQVMNGFSGKSSFQNPNLGIISWTQMPMHLMNFGWGSPVFAAPASVRSEGKVYILAGGPSKEDGLWLFICLETHHLDLFKQYFYNF